MEVEVISGHSVYVEDEANKEETVYIQWDDLKENQRLEIEKRAKEISEKSYKLKEVILSCTVASKENIYYSSTGNDQREGKRTATMPTVRQQRGDKIL